MSTLYFVTSLIPDLQVWHAALSVPPGDEPRS